MLKCFWCLLRILIYFELQGSFCKQIFSTVHKSPVLNPQFLADSPWKILRKLSAVPRIPPFPPGVLYKSCLNDLKIWKKCKKLFPTLRIRSVLLLSSWMAYPGTNLRVFLVTSQKLSSVINSKGNCERIFNFRTTLRYKNWL